MVRLRGEAAAEETDRHREEGRRDQERRPDNSNRPGPGEDSRGNHRLEGFMDNVIIVTNLGT